jgi:hypothetical protein
MKKLILLGLAIVLLTACQKKGPERWVRDSPEIKIAKTLVKDYQDGNWESWIGHYADTAKVHHNSVESISPQQLEEALKNDISNYSHYGFSDKDIYYEMIIDEFGDKWVYFWGTWEGTMNSTNENFIIPVHLDLKFVNNKIVEEYGYYNRSSIDTALKSQPSEKDLKTEG